MICLNAEYRDSWKARSDGLIIVFSKAKYKKDKSKIEEEKEEAAARRMRHSRWTLDASKL